MEVQVLMTKLVKAGLESWGGDVCRQVIYASLVLPCDEVKGEVRFFTLIRVELSKRRWSADRFRISKKLLDSGARIDPIFALR